MAKRANKIEYFGDVLIDLSADSVVPSTLLKGTTAHDKSGNPIEGEMEMNVSYDDTTGELTITSTLEGAMEYNSETGDLTIGG